MPSRKKKIKCHRLLSLLSFVSPSPPPSLVPSSEKLDARWLFRRLQAPPVSGSFSVNLFENSPINHPEMLRGKESNSVM